MAPATLRRNIFVSYSHKGNAWLERLKIHLAPYLQGEELFRWDDSKIPPGANFDEVINQALSKARGAVLLVTPAFLASDYVFKVELLAILARAEEDMAVPWIPVSPSAFDKTPLASMQAAHDPQRPLATLSRPKQDEALVSIAKKISASININAIGNSLKMIDALTPEVAAFISGSPEPNVEITYPYRAEQKANSLDLVESSGRTKLIQAEDLESLDSNDQKLIRAYERTMDRAQAETDLVGLPNQG